MENSPHVIVPLTRGYEAVIDTSDAEAVFALSWYVTISKYCTTPYANAYVPGSAKRIGLHRFLMGNPPGVLIDHRDGNGLNCRRCNLRRATHSLNTVNSKSRNPKSGFRGVTSARDKWMGYITVNGVRRHLGVFAEPEGAALAYNMAALEAFGEFARLNLIGGFDGK